MIWVALLGVLGLFSGFGLLFWVGVQAINTFSPLLTRKPEVDWGPQIRDLEYAVDMLPQKWEEMLREAKRAEGRARAVARRAKDELAERGFESPAVESELGELRLLDGEGSLEQPLLPLSEGMDDVAPAITVDPWVAATRAALAKKFG